MFGRPRETTPPAFQARSGPLNLWVYEDDSAFRRTDGEIPPHWRIVVFVENYGERSLREEFDGPSNVMFLLGAIRDAIAWIDGRKLFFRERARELESSSEYKLSQGKEFEHRPDPVDATILNPALFRRPG